MNKSNTILLSLIAVLIAVQLVLSGSSGSGVLGGSDTSSNQASSTTRTVGTSSTLVMTALGHTQFVCVGRNAWIGLAGSVTTSTIGNGGTEVATGTCIGPLHVSGNINAATDGGTSDVGVLDLK